MAEPHERTFPCPGCGRRFYWREANIGRRLRCHVCGRQVEVPREPPEGVPPSEASSEAGALPAEQAEAPSAEALPPASEAALAAAAEAGEAAAAPSVALAFARAHWGKVLAVLVAATLACLWYGRVQPVHRKLAEVQAGLREATRIRDLTLAAPFLSLSLPAKVAASGTTSVPYGARDLYYRVEAPYVVRLEPRAIVIPFGSSVVFSGRVAGEYDTAARRLTLEGDLTALSITGHIHFELNTVTP
ncbi:MAG TPA: hypothetical protein PLE19_15060 [Planctomycetota bacterium]|nr:hypothetical protein [Planctomycetota bacterium]HRR80595.1 hypothetical protein [Planctomycetota bacterium]HRT95822.1 hypothetical protein [Planctomycetota bacterium]